MSSQSPEDDQTSSQLRDNEHDALVALLDNFIADNAKKRRLKLEGIVSHGQKLATEYQADVKNVLEQADAEIDKRIEAFQQEEALRIDQTRELESQLLALLQKRSNSVELAAGTVDQEIAKYVEASQKLTKEIEAIADEEMVYFEKQRELLFSAPPPCPSDKEGERSPQQHQQDGQEGEPVNAGPAAGGGVGGPSSDDQFEYADPPARSLPRARRPAATGPKKHTDLEPQKGGVTFAETTMGEGGTDKAAGAMPMQVDPRA